VTDGLPAAALSVDPKDPDIMKRAPRNPKRGLLYGMLGFILFATVLDFCSDFFVFMWLFYTTGDVDRARTIAFTIVVIFELYLVLNCRSETKSLFQQGWPGITANKFLLASIVGGLFLKLAIVYIPVLQPIFHTTALNAGDLLIFVVCSALGIFTLPELFIFLEVNLVISVFIIVIFDIVVLTSDILPHFVICSVFAQSSMFSLFGREFPLQLYLMG